LIAKTSALVSVLFDVSFLERLTIVTGESSMKKEGEETGGRCS
jgi:hypothetical protein